LVLRIHGDRLIGKLVHDSLVCLNGRIVGALFLARKANIELRPRGVFSVRCSPDDVSEDSHRPIQRRGERNAKELQLLSVKINFADSELCLDCFLEMRIARIFFY